LTAIHDVDRMIALDVPWWTYAAIDKVDQFLSDHNGARVFEYGSGASTVWLSKRALSITSVEHDKDWYNVLGSRLTNHKNIDLILRPPKSAHEHNQKPIISEKSGYEDMDFTDYLYAVKDGGQLYDLIVIDGRVRSECLRVAVRHLSKNGMIVFDNSARNRYQTAIQNSGGLIYCQKGFVPSLPYRDETTLITFPKR
jgi:predicted O-methyltransferase YrrM